MNGMDEWQKAENERLSGKQTQPAHFGKYSKTIREMQTTINYLGKFMESEIDRRDAKIEQLRAALQNMIDIYWAEGDGQLPEPKCIIDARAALS